ncbi:MAG: T9SS type A sorting domain-containing protein [Bacteroidota bacterium]
MKKYYLIAIILIASITVNAQYTVSSIPYNPYPYNAGTAVNANMDDTWSGIINLPFNFYIYGANYNKLIVGSNGSVSFKTTLANAFCQWSYLYSCPNAQFTGTGPVIFGPYHDIYNSNAGTIKYEIYDVAPYRKFVISWDSIPMFSCTNLYATQQIVLYESTNDIDVNIENKPLCTAWNSGNAVIGIQDSLGTIGITPPGRNTGQWTANNESWRFSMNGPFSLNINIVNIVNTLCNTNNGVINTAASGGNFPYTYLWNSNPPQTSQNLTGVPAGNYCITVTDSNGDTASTCGTVGTLPYIVHPFICMVTADSISNHNLVVWEKPITTSIDQYYIYRESSVSGVYDLIGTQAYSDFSTFLDYSSNTLQQPYRYKIATLDYCGDTLAQFSYHQTIHLTINPGVTGNCNLLWNSYEGFSFYTYNIYRGTNASNLALLASVSSNVNSFTDIAPPLGMVYYLIEAVNPTPCNPSAKTGGFSSPISNIAKDIINGVAENNMDLNMQISPNPALDVLNLHISGNTSIAEIKIYNLLGQINRRLTTSTQETNINISDLARGAYIIEVRNDKNISRAKFIKE